MTLTDFIQKYSGKKIDWDGAFGAQCVDLYRFYLHEVLQVPQSKPIPGAADIWDTIDINVFEKIANTPTGIPKRGDVVIWNKKAGGGYGHVAVFIEGGVSTFKSLDQNWPVNSPVHVQQHDYTNVIGWLRLRRNDEDLERIIDELRIARDNNWNLYQETKTKLEEAESTIVAFNDFRHQLSVKLNTDDQTTAIIGAVERFLNLEDQLRLVTADLEKERTAKEKLQQDNDSYVGTISNLQKEIDATEALKDAYRKAEEELKLLRKTKVIDRFTTGELIKEVLNRLTGR